ncbi:MAG TPA: hypothetical protein VNJ53_08655, partial [Gaiellaceae bacterium]|nr:hypothetical protein [Gaiellaceae bacterium]
GPGRAAVRIANAGSRRVVADVRVAGFALDLRGRPRIVAGGGARRSASAWLQLRPRRLVLRPGAARAVAIVSRPPPGAEPGDHDALVLVTTRARVRDRIAVRMRLGVVVVVRVPGAIRRRLELRGLRVVRGRRARALELLVANRGNVTESFTGRRTAVFLERAGRRIARLAAEPRTLRPGTMGVLQFRYRSALAGPALARVEVVSEGGAALRRTVRVRL